MNCRSTARAAERFWANQLRVLLTAAAYADAGAAIAGGAYGVAAR